MLDAYARYGEEIHAAHRASRVTDAAIREYIRQQAGTEPDDGGDHFRVTPSGAEDFSP